MKYSVLGRTGLKVSQLSLGSGGGNPLGQRSPQPMTESDIRCLLHGALDLGVNMFDTAPGYDESESILGRALKGVSRERFLMSTKVRLLSRDRQTISKPQEVIDSVENSLKRLQVEHIDVLLMAGVLEGGHYDCIVNELWPVAQRLKDAGKVRFIGASESSSMDGSHQWLERLLKDDLVDAVMVAYNLINQSAENVVFPLCRENNVGAMAIYSVRRVFSSTQRLREVIADLEERNRIPRNSISLDNPLGWLPDGPEDSLIRSAYRFSASHPAVSTVVTGTHNLEHLKFNIQALGDGPLPREKTHRLKEIFAEVDEPIGN